MARVGAQRHRKEEEEATIDLLLINVYKKPGG